MKRERVTVRLTTNATDYCSAFDDIQIIDNFNMSDQDQHKILFIKLFSVAELQTLHAQQETGNLTSPA